MVRSTMQKIGKLAINTNVGGGGMGETDQSRKVDDSGDGHILGMWFEDGQTKDNVTRTGMNYVMAIILVKEETVVDDPDEEETSTVVHREGAKEENKGERISALIKEESSRWVLENRQKISTMIEVTSNDLDEQVMALFRETERKRKGE